MSKLYVGNFPYETSETQLKELFSDIGTVVSVEIVYDGKGQKSKGFGFVVMSSVDEALDAIEKLHGRVFMGRKLVVNQARASEKTKSLFG